jgi:hypothetical protein
MGTFFVSVITTRRSTKTTLRSVHKLRYGYEGPVRQLDWFVFKLSEGLSSDWTFNVMQITEFEYEALTRSQEASHEPV